MISWSESLSPCVSLVWYYCFGGSLSLVCFSDTWYIRLKDRGLNTVELREAEINWGESKTDYCFGETNPQMKFEAIFCLALYVWTGSKSHYLFNLISCLDVLYFSMYCMYCIACIVLNPVLWLGNWIRHNIVGWDVHTGSSVYPHQPHLSTIPSMSCMDFTGTFPGTVHEETWFHITEKHRAI